jgi:hypothetical protein
MLDSDVLRKRERRLRRNKTGDAVGRPTCESSFLDAPGAKFFCGKRKLTKFREHLSQSR